MRRRDIGGCAVVVLLTVCLGCQQPSGSPAPEQTASSVATGIVECPRIDLRTPQGTHIDLTATWTSGSVEAGDQMVYQLRQSGECLWGRAYSAFEGQELGESFDMVLVGHVQSDFTARLDLLEIRVSGPLFPSFGRATAEMVITPDPETEGGVVLEISELQARPHEGAGSGLGSLFPSGGPAVGQVLIRSP